MRRACGAYMERDPIRSNRIDCAIDKLSYRHDHLASVALSDRARPPPPFRPGGGGLRHHPAGAVDADPRARARDRRRAGRAPAGRDRAHRDRPRGGARAEHILAATRDLVDFARHRDVLSGRLRLGIIPTLAPYLLPRCCRCCRRAIRGLRLEVRETQTEQSARRTGGRRARLRDAGAAGRRTPMSRRCRCSTIAFLLAVPAADPLPAHARVDVADVDQRRLILLEEGHCLRDQALAFCATKRRDQPARPRRNVAATVMQMVANGYGVTLVPEVAVDVEAARRARQAAALRRSRSPAAPSGWPGGAPRRAAMISRHWARW